MFTRPAFPLIVILLSWIGALPATAATLEQETSTRIEQLRAVKAGQSGPIINTYNREMNEAWQFYAAHKPAILPILREQLKAEIARDQPSDLVLLDVGLYVHENDGAEGKTVSRDALFRLDPHAAVVNENRKELFELTHAAAEDHDARVLALIDRVFLNSDEKIFIPQHALTLDGTLICVFLYGAYGADVEPHLSAKLHDQSDTKRVLELLSWLGSPGSVGPVGDAWSASPNYETFSRMTSFMMQVAGPAGRDFMLKIDPNKLDPKSREYFAKIHSAIQDMSFDAIRASMTRFPGDKTLSDTEVEARLAALTASYGKDDRTSPAALLDSGVGADFLIASLTKVRSLMLYRLSDEALSDVEVTNAVIDALRYRGHQHQNVVRKAIFSGLR